MITMVRGLLDGSRNESAEQATPIHEHMAFSIVIFWNSGDLNKTKYNPFFICMVAAFLENAVSIKIM